MKAEILKKEKLKIKFVLDNVNSSFVNALRRTVITDIPTLAIEDVSISKNDSVLFDEIIAHRLGLIPIVTDLKTFVPPDACKCKGKGCAKCQVKFKLKAVGPSVVYSEQLKSADPKIKPAFEKMPIVKLKEGQAVELEAVAVLGTGKEHTKWSAGTLTFQRYPEVEVDLKKCNGCGKCIDACPKNIFEGKDKPKVKNNKVIECHLCKACEDICEKKAITVKGLNDKYIIEVESWGQLKPSEILEQAGKINKEQLEEFKSELK